MTYTRIDAHGVFRVSGSPAVVLAAMIGRDHEVAAGGLCTDPEGTGSCAVCRVLLIVCGACGGRGYHRAACPESEEAV